MKSSKIHHHHINSGCTGMIESKAVPCPYNVILGRDMALPWTNFGY